MLNDVDHFRTKLNKVAGAGELSDKLFELVQAKNVAAAEDEEEKPNSPDEEQNQDKGTDLAES